MLNWNGYERASRGVSSFAGALENGKRGLLLPLVTLPLACAADVGEVFADKQLEIAGGMRDRGDPNVVLLLSWDGSDPTGTLDSCTANVVAPDVLLTAAHCLVAEREFYAAYLGDDGRDLGTPIDPGRANVRAQLHLAEAVHPHPQYVTTSGYYDVGIVVLRDRLPDITALPILRTRPSPSILRDVSIVGYGKTHDRDTSFAVTKYRADRLSAVLDPTHTMTVGDDVRHACVGDSGGPVLADLQGVPTIIGIDSYSDETGDATRCRMASRYQRVDPYLAFIDRYVPRHESGDGGVAAAEGGIADVSDAGPDGSAGSNGEADDVSVDAGRSRDAGRHADASGVDDPRKPVPDAASTDDEGEDENDDAAKEADEPRQEQAQASDGCAISKQGSERSGLGVLAVLVGSFAWRRRPRHPATR